MREREYIMSYLGLAAALGGLLMVSWGNWGKSIGYSASIVGMSIVIAYFILCGILIGVRKRCKAGWVQKFSEIAKKKEFGYLSLTLGLFALGISLAQLGYLWSILTGLTLFIAGCAVYAFGPAGHPDVTHKNNTD